MTQTVHLLRAEIGKMLAAEWTKWKLSKFRKRLSRLKAKVND